jgi:hypothetical protein
MSVSEPGLELHEWETRWQELQEQLATDADGTLPDVADFVEQLLDEAGVELDEPVAVEGDSRALVESLRAAQEVAERVERGEDVDPGDIGQAIEDLRSIYASVTAERPS